MNKINITRKQIIIFVILFAGLIVSLILIRQPQIFKGRADVDVTSAFTIKGVYDEEVNCSENICGTEADEVTIEVTDPNIFLED